jgi:hypothetical protein
MQIISSAAEVIDVLGGYKRIAVLFGVVPSAPCNWRKRGRLPPKTFVVFTRELSKRGLVASPDLWAMHKEADGKPRRRANAEMRGHQKELRRLANGR